MAVTQLFPERTVFSLPPLDAIAGTHVALECSGVSEEISAVEIQFACTSGQGNVREARRQDQNRRKLRLAWRD